MAKEEKALIPREEVNEIIEDIKRRMWVANEAYQMIVRDLKEIGTEIIRLQERELCNSHDPELVQKFIVGFDYGSGDIFKNYSEAFKLRNSGLPVLTDTVKQRYRFPLSQAEIEDCTKVEHTRMVKKIARTYNDFVMTPSKLKKAIERKTQGACQIP